MNCNELQQHLADLLGDELHGEPRTAAEAHLAECPTCRGLVAELQDVARLVSARAPTLPEAWRSVCAAPGVVEGAAGPARDEQERIAAGPTRGDRGPRIRTRSLAFARYAAAAAVAFGLGYAARDVGGRSTPSAAPSTAVVAEQSDRFEARFARASQSHPHASTLGRALLALAD
jgi:hypothetical protein